MKRRIRRCKVAALVLAMLCASVPVWAAQEDETATEAEGGTEAEAATEAETLIEEAEYLGVEGYGLEETNKDNKDHFQFRFLVDGEEKLFLIDNGPKDADGEYEYPIQNILKEGGSYSLTVDGDTVVDAKEIPAEAVSYNPPVAGEPGVKTLENFLRTALMPVGTTLYIYGGGWDWQDVGSSVQTRSLGVSDDWVRFFNQQDENFTYKGVDGDEENVDPTTSYYPYGEYNEYYYAGLDCSGFVGWVIYNTFEAESGREGYVRGATGMAKAMAEKEWGTWTQDVQIPDGSEKTAMKPGDVMSINGHVWISLGTCDDGSVVIVHSTPTMSRTGQPGGGVQVGAVGPDEGCEAYLLADKIMTTFYPEWSERYETALKDPEAYFTFEGEDAGKFSWTPGKGKNGLDDQEHLQDMGAREVLEYLFDTEL